MRITKYRTELNNNKHNILVKENCSNYSVDNLNNPENIANMLNDVFGLNRLAEEHIYMIALNTKSMPLGVFEISHGTVNLSLCNPRDLYIKALLCGATYIVIAHNHPSGDTRPSDMDLKVSKRILEVGELMGINLLDFLIIGDDYYSFKEDRIL